MAGNERAVATTEVVDLTPELAIASFNEHERKAYENIRDSIRRECISEIKGRYALAQQVYKIYMDTKSASSKYGANFVKRLAIALGYKTANPLYEMVHVIETWPTWDALEVQVLERMDGTRQIRWKDTVVLARLQNDPVQFQAAIEQIKDATPVKQLQYTFKAEGSTRQGRNPQAPETLSDLCHEVVKTMRGMNRRFDQSWEPFDVISVCKELYDSQDVTDDEIMALKNQLQSALSMLEVAEEVVQELKSIFTKAVQIFNIEDNTLAPTREKRK